MTTLMSLKLGIGALVACSLTVVPLAAIAAEPSGEKVVAVGDSISTGYNAVAPR